MQCESLCPWAAPHLVSLGGSKDTVPRSKDMLTLVSVCPGVTVTTANIR